MHAFILSDQCCKIEKSDIGKLDKKAFSLKENCAKGGNVRYRQSKIVNKKKEK